MEYVVDTANIEAIKHINEFYPLRGVTTNPSIISKENTQDFIGHLKKIRAIIGPDKMLCAQTLQTEADKIVEEGVKLNKEIGGDFYLKIPIGEAGLKATMELKKLGVKVLMTAIFTPAQALMAATAGADYVAPYVNRLDNVLADGVGVVAAIVNQFDLYGVNCKCLAASFKNSQQVHECAQVGCHSVTIAPEIFKLLISHPLTDVAIQGFEKDWKSVYGDKQIIDLV